MLGVFSWLSLEQHASINNRRGAAAGAAAGLGPGPHETGSFTAFNVRLGARFYPEEDLAAELPQRDHSGARRPMIRLASHESDPAVTWKGLL